MIMESKLTILLNTTNLKLFNPFGTMAQPENEINFRACILYEESMKWIFALKFLQNTRINIWPVPVPAYGLKFR